LKLKYNIGFLAICLMVLSSCSSTRYVPEGELLLKQTRVARGGFSDSHLSRNDFVHLQRQQPNERLLRFPLKLKMYSSVNRERKTWWTEFMQRVGEPPVIFDSLYADQTVQRMQQFLVNNGHFNSTVYYVVDSLRRAKTMRLVFHVNTGPGYRYRNVSLDIRDDSLANSLNDWPARTLIRSGQPYNVGILDAERARVTRRMQNIGFFNFRRDNIEYLIDSALNANLMDITMIVNPPRDSEHNRRYTFDEVYIFPDERPGRSKENVFDTTIYRMPNSRTDTALQNYYFIHSKPLRIKPHAIVSKLLIRPGETYSLNNVDRTYENLWDLRVFRSTNISMHAQPIDTNNPQYLLNTSIEVQQALTWATEVNLDLTTSSGLQGTAANVALRNRNLFGGAEILSLQLRGLVEVQYLLNKNRRNEFGLDLINNFDVGLSANLEFPRFIVPFNFQQTSLHRPRTLVSVGYYYQLRPTLYNRQTINTSFAYSWRQPRFSHVLFPLDINLVNISLKPAFADTIAVLSETNRRLRYQYDNHFIFAARYSFAFSGQTNRPVSFNAFRFSIESSGNSLFLLSNLLNAKKNDSTGQYQFFNLPYAQYLRFDADLKRYWYLTDNQVLVTRLMGGVGFAYGNFEVLPYEKGFFAGGNNNIRAWPLNFLGPGSYGAPDGSKIERVGDIVLVGNIEYRFPISGIFNGALFVDAGNIWLRNDSESFPGGLFEWKNVPNDLAVGGGVGLRLDFNFFVIRLDAAVPLRDPAKPNGEKWVISNTQLRDFVLNFGIGYPF